MTKSPFRKFSVLTILALFAAAFTGCSDGDKDSDGVRDNADQCITVAAGRTPDPARPGCPAADSDRDGVLDSNDVCPGMPVGNGVEADPNRAGCPAAIVIPTPPTPPPVLPNGQDHDGDNVLNETDQCPTVAVGNDPDPSRPGCPDGDGDGDGVRNGSDRCPVVASTEANDPDGDGCPNRDTDGDGVIDTADQCPDLPETRDAGTSADGGTADANAADVVDAGNPHPGCPLGHEPTVTSDGGTTVEADATVTADAANIDPDGGAVQVADAGVTATNDVVPGNGNTTVIVQVNPTPAPVVDAGAPSQPIPTERNVAGLAIGTLIEGTSGRTAANTFCWITRRQVDYLMTHAFNRECREGETSCWRLANANVHVLDCGTTATPGCRFQDGRIFACETGAENIVVRHCAQGTVPCTAQNVVDAERTRHPSR